MKHNVIGAAAVAAAILSASARADIVSVEPDAQPVGSFVENAYPGVHLTTTSTWQVLSVHHNYATTGHQTFGVWGTDSMPWYFVGSTYPRYLQIAFDKRARSVSMDAICGWSFTNARLEAYDATGTLIDAVNGPTMHGQGDHQNLSLSHLVDDIAFVRVGGLDFGVAVDNVAYEIPSPGAAGPWALALCGALARRRRAGSRKD